MQVVEGADVSVAHTLVQSVGTHVSSDSSQCGDRKSTNQQGLPCPCSVLHSITLTVRQLSDVHAEGSPSRRHHSCRGLWCATQALRQLHIRQAPARV